MTAASVAAATAVDEDDENDAQDAGNEDSIVSGSTSKSIQRQQFHDKSIAGVRGSGRREADAGTVSICYHSLRAPHLRVRAASSARYYATRFVSTSTECIVSCCLHAPPEVSVRNRSSS